MQPVLRQLSQEGWTIRSVDTDQEPQLTQQFQIQNLPTLVILSGGQEVDRLVGVTSHAQVQKRLERVAARNATGRNRSAGIPSAAQPQSPTPPPQAPIVRGQSPGMRALSGLATGALASQRLAAEPTAPRSLSIDEAIQRAVAATVRIRVDEGNTTAFGTGTIVDVHGEEALVLTCGHLFRDMQPNSQLTVDLFAGTPQEVTLTSQLIDFQAEDADIGLISFRLPVRIEPVEILPRNEQLQVGQQAFSFGCDRGADPTRRDTRIKSINRYLGAANVEIAGAPAVGRSGGGLFDVQGRLIGVCNAADATDDEGIYAAAEVVYAQIERLGLSHLFENSPSSQMLAATPASSPIQSASFDTPLSSPAETPPKEAQWPDESAAFNAASASPNALRPTSRAGQLICIVRDGQGRDQVVTIDSPSPDLLEQIRRSAHQ